MEDLSSLCFQIKSSELTNGVINSVFVLLFKVIITYSSVHVIKINQFLNICRLRKYCNMSVVNRSINCQTQVLSLQIFDLTRH